MVAVRLEADQVVALACRDGSAWTKLAAFPRSEFSGEPKIIRLGKMNLRAEANNYAGDLGAPGKCLISDFNQAEAVQSPAAFELNTKANQAETEEYPFPAGTKFVSCRIDKGSDQGVLWSPALALVWEDGGKYLLVGVRDAKPVFNVTTAAGEKVVDGKLVDYPALGLPSSTFQLDGAPKLVRPTPAPDGVRVADRIGGVALEAELV